MRALRVGRLALLAWALAAPASAHLLPGPPDRPPGWTLDPWITVPLGLALLLFAVGWRRLRVRSGPGAAGLRRRAGLFLAGWATLVVGLVSPLHQAGEQAFTPHMLEHELLMLLAAPLLVLSEPLAVFLWAFPAWGRKAIGRLTRSRALAGTWRALTEPVTATLLQASALWLWHMPTLFDRALASARWHVAQHVCFLLSALLFWSAMLHRRAGPGRAAGWMTAAVCLFATSVVSGALGAVMAFSESPWYVAYSRMGMAPFGLTPAEDQQLAGLLMWVPGGLVHAGAALALVAAALRTEPADAV